MGLSIDKLNQIILSKGYLPRRFFKLYGTCIFIEIIAVKTAETYIIYIPSKYEFNVDNLEAVYKLKVIDIENNEKDDDGYVNDAQEDDIEDKYDEIEIDTKESKEDEDIEDQMENKYKKEINIKDIEDYSEVKSICRQLKRFKYCVQGIPYKLLIIFKNYICFIHRDNHIECFYIKKFSAIDKKQLYISMDLEVFYENTENINTLNKNISHIKESLFKILDKNHISHSIVLEDIMSNQINLTEVSEGIQTEKTKYTNYIKRFEDLLSDVGEADDELIKKMKKLNDKKRTDVAYQGLHGDIQYSHEKKQIDDNIDKISTAKEEITKNLLELKSTLDNVTLLTDELLFDNIVMLHKIRQNLKTLKNIFNN